MPAIAKRAAVIAAACLATAVPAAVAHADSSPSIAQLQQSLRSGGTTCREVVSAALARARAVESGRHRLRAILQLNPDALAIAKRLDARRRAGRRLGPLYCVPVLIKDNYGTADRLATTAGSLVMRGFHTRRDAYVVRRWRKAGAVVLGKSNMDEWAHGANGYSSIGGQIHNGRREMRGPGGSSGGSASAVAAGVVPLATGSDTGGSIQIPAAFNGVAGLRPTMGLISRGGIVPFASSTDEPGPIADSVEDLARVLGTMTGVDPADPATRASAGHFRRDYTPELRADGLQGARIGVLRKVVGERFDGYSDDVDGALEKALATLRGAGATVVDGLPELRANRVAWLDVADLVLPEFRPEIEDWLHGPGRGAPVSSLREIVAASQVPPARGKVRILKLLKTENHAPPVGNPKQVRARASAARFRRAVLAYMKRHHLDAVIYEATGCPAPPLPGLVDPTFSCRGVKQPLKFGKGGGSIAPLLSPITGLPVLSLPGAQIPGDQLAGLSLLGRRWSEGRLLRYGYAFQQAAAAGR